MSVDAFPPTATIAGPSGEHRVVSLAAAAGDALVRMPWCHRVLLENVLRQPDREVAEAGRDALLAWLDHARSEAEIPFAPTRILMHDTTCGPALVDIAAMRDALAEAGGDPALLNPLIPVATSTDHSLAVDVSAVPDALGVNMRRELDRNAERYGFMKWAANALAGFRVFPPGTGIMHTINMERLATVVTTETREGVSWAYPDTLVGTDSHTPMVNGLGVLAWGVGGIEAEGVMFGVPVSIRVPDVIGVRLRGRLRDGVLATDLALVVTERLRKRGVTGEFVEFFGPGVGALSVGERGVIANMAPEYGASTGCFPIDEQTLGYLRATGRSDEHVSLVEAYARANALWYDPAAEPTYTDVLDVDVDALTPSMAGPKRPQDRLAPADVPALVADVVGRPRPDGIPGDPVAVAALTSCTNTTDFGLLVTAGLVARKAREAGLRPPAWVKTSMTPGSPAAGERLRRAGLLEDLEAVGFGVAGYGCATCIGNSGPLLPVMTAAIDAGGVRPFAVLSGNRNFPGRVHTQIDDALLASPPLVVAYAIAGHVGVDITRDPLGTASDGRAVRLAELWPTADEVDAAKRAGTSAEWVVAAYDEAEASPSWTALPAPATERYPWDAASTYLRRPPFVTLRGGADEGPTMTAHPLFVLGDDITTDHISPAGAINGRGDAAAWLVEHGEDPKDLNVYASRRGNWEVMLRGLFTNRNVVNLLCPDAPAGHAVHSPTGEVMAAWKVARRYAEASKPVVIVAGERYGMGSSRDWAAKGVQLMGARAVLANSFERIHRANLVCMGVLPLRLPEGWRPQGMDVKPDDVIELAWNLERLTPGCDVLVTVRFADGGLRTGVAKALVETTREVELIKAGGIISLILRRALAVGRRGAIH